MIRISTAVASALFAAPLLISGLNAAPTMAQTRPAVAATPGPAALLATDQWRDVAPENLLVIDTTKGRVLVELYPGIAPSHVERIQTLARQGFYDGLKFHRVLAGFMAQTGDPQGTGEGGSDLPDLKAEFAFRRGRGAFQPVAGGGDGYRGYFNGIPVQTQPDAQMFVTADMKVDAHGLFCPGVAGMARTGGSPDSANSQFYLMTGRSDPLNAQYTVFGRVVGGLDVVKALNVGAEAQNGTVINPDLMNRVRLADAIPAAERPSARVMDPRSPTFVARVEAARATGGLTFNVCDVEVPAEVTGG